MKPACTDATGSNRNNLNAQAGNDHDARKDADTGESQPAKQPIRVWFGCEVALYLCVRVVTVEKNRFSRVSGNRDESFSFAMLPVEIDAAIAASVTARPLAWSLL